MNKLETPSMFTEPEAYHTVCMSGQVHLCLIIGECIVGMYGHWIGHFALLFFFSDSENEVS